MDRQQWKDLLEGIGYVAIIASLVFVGLETRNGANQTVLNTQAMEIAAYQELINNISEMNALSIQNQDAASVLANVYGQDDIEKWRSFMALVMIFRHGDMAFFMYERGVIDESRLISTLRPLPLRSQTGREFWTHYAHLFVPSYREYVDNLTDEGFWD